MELYQWFLNVVSQWFNARLNQLGVHWLELSPWARDWRCTAVATTGTGLDVGCSCPPVLHDACQFGALFEEAAHGAALWLQPLLSSFCEGGGWGLTLWGSK